MPLKTASARTAHWLWPPLLLLGCATVVIAWLLVTLTTGRQSGWMALLAAFEIVWVLRLGTLRTGRIAAAIATLATAATIVASNWAIASTQLGAAMGLDPWASALKMGPHLAWTLLSMANGGVDWLCYAIALALAVWTAR